jgi:hypothetical protein
MVAGVATSGLVYGLDLPVSETAARWFSIGVGALVTVSYVRSTWPRWQGEDSPAAVGHSRDVTEPRER